MHARPFQTGLHDHFIGTFDHARANGPPLPLIGGILHQRYALAKIVHLLLDGLKLSESSRQAITPAQEETWTTMFEDM